MKLDSQVVGNAGLYYTCYHLSLLGWNAMPTARNARGIDVIAYNRGGSHFIGVQVKSLSKKSPVPLGKSLDRVMSDFWVIVTKVATAPTAYVMLPGEIGELAHCGEKEGRLSYWLQPRAYDVEEYREAWNRIGRGDVSA